MKKPVIPYDQDSATIDVSGRPVSLTNLGKIFWKDLNLTKGDLIRYYLKISSYLLPHIVDRAMVMKRYPHGAQGDFFYMKRSPVPRPEWVQTCSLKHGAGNVID